MKMMTRLHVNVDHVATLRQARGVNYPDPVPAASMCEIAGASGITMHLREDRRHIIDRDIRLARETVTTILNLEMAATDEMVEIACRLKPDISTLVPEKREERTTEGGLNVSGAPSRIAGVVSSLKQAGIRVSLFITPELEEIEASKAVGADTIELHTGEYCNAPKDAVLYELDRIKSCARAAHNLGLEVAAGHGLHYHNVRPISHIPEIIELNIGHSIISRAVYVGMDAAVRQMLEAMGEK
jgi:pyridoxine 5-phosphate synthase